MRVISFPLRPPRESQSRSGLTELVLQHPDLQLDEAVCVEAVVLPHAAVADFVAAEVQLARRTQGPDFGISDRTLLQNVDQAPGEARKGDNAIGSRSRSLR